MANIVYLSRNIPIYNEKLKNTAGKEVDLYGQVGWQRDSPGGEILFDVLFIDDSQLVSYKVEIHRSFDGRTHSILKQESQQENKSFTASLHRGPTEINRVFG